jgi:phage terminase small subunit
MPILAKQRWEEFAQGMVAGKSATKAYIDAGFSKHGAAQAAYKLSKHPSVANRIAELRRVKRQAEIHAAEARESAVLSEVVISAAQFVLTRQWVIDELIDTVRMAKHGTPGEDGEFRPDLKAANRALELLGKEIKMFVDRSERGKPGEFDNLTTEEVRARLEAIRAIRRASGDPTLKLVE